MSIRYRPFLMRPLAVVVLFAFTVSGCGHGVPQPDFTLPQVLLTSPVGSALTFDNATALAEDGANPVLPLFAIPNIKTNVGELDLEFWGTKDAAGNILQLTEAGVSGLNGPAGSVHVFFDISKRPVLFRDDATGYSMRISYDSTTQETITICDPSDAPLGQAQLSVVNGIAIPGPVADGGSCSAITALAIGHASPGGITPSASSGVPTSLNDLPGLAKLIQTAGLILGIALIFASYFKFHQHKGGPIVDVPLTTGLTVLFIAAALILYPGVFSVSGSTIFGPGANGVDGFLPFYEPESSLPGCSPPSSACPFPSPEPTP